MNEQRTWLNQLKSCLSVDFRRMLTTPLFYIFLGISFLIPILVLVMTTSMPSVMVDPVTGVETTIETFTSVWQIIGSSSTTASGMDIMSMCNINLLYFLIAVFVCLFITGDFTSGYAKNIFTVKPTKKEYCISKILAGFVASVLFILIFLVGAMIGGGIAGLSFTIAETNAFGIAMCIISKMLLSLVFVGIALLTSVVAKQKAWLSIVLSIGVGMLLYMMIPMISPIHSTIINAVMSLIAGCVFSVGMGFVSSVVLNKISLF